MTFIHPTPTGTVFDYTAFVDAGFESQQKYAEAAGVPGPLDDLTHAERYAKVIEMMGHLQEEIIEARVWVPRRSWKTAERSFLDSPENRKEFIAEMADQLLFHRAILAYSGISGEEFAEVAMEKFAYNTKRKDHNVNGDEPAPSNPAAELQGDCASSVFYHTV